ncbi:Protein SAAL1 [Trichoplax sp. H2]|nr:Protein SAAL1 [Trichoplax sp. H2]|eukprot:RDD42839.1 Protein SAAL1 [Trichoplax sp. H2]
MAANRNPSPPPPDSDDPDVHHLQAISDAIGDTVYSQLWVTSLLKELINHLNREDDEDVHQQQPIDHGADSSSQATSTKIPMPACIIENDGNLCIAFDEEICKLWDMSSDIHVANYLLEIGILQILIAIIVKSKSARLTEISVGILANMACHRNVCFQMTLYEEIFLIIPMLLQSPDPPILLESIRLIRSFISCPNAKEKWLVTIKENVIIYDSITFILASSVNNDLLRSTCCLTYEILYEDDQLLTQWATPQLLDALCEAVKQLNGDTRSQENLFLIMQLISSKNRGVTALVENETAISLICQFMIGYGQSADSSLQFYSTLTAILSIINVMMTLHHHLVLKYYIEAPEFLTATFQFLKFAILKTIPAKDEDASLANFTLDEVQHSSSYDDDGSNVVKYSRVIVWKFLEILTSSLAENYNETILNILLCNCKHQIIAIFESYRQLAPFYQEKLRLFANLFTMTDRHQPFYAYLKERY